MSVFSLSMSDVSIPEGLDGGSGIHYSLNN